MLGANMLSMSALSLYRNAVQFGMSIAITAFIGPAEYGLVVFTLPFVTLIAMLTDLGLSSAIVRAPELTAGQAGAAFTLMLTVGAGLAAAMAIGAYPLAGWLAMPGLGGVMASMAIVVLLTVTATTPRALIERQLRYGRIAAIEAAAVFVAAAVALLAAWQGAGVWALVLYNLINHMLRVTAFLILARPELDVNLRWRCIGPLVSFGGWVLATNLLNFLARNSDNLLVGAWLGSAAVGLYGLAYQFMLAPLMAITWPVSAILLSTLRHGQSRPERNSEIIEGVMAITALITFPAMAFLAIGLEFPVGALLSERWHAVPAIVTWLAPIGALQSISSYNGAVLLVAGMARRQFLYMVLNTAVLLVTFVVTLPFGMMAMVHGFVVASALLGFGLFALMVSAGAVTWQAIASALMPALVATLGGVMAVAAIGGLHPASWQQWSLGAAVFGIVVLGIYAALFGRLRRRFGALRAAAG